MCTFISRANKSCFCPDIYLCLILKYLLDPASLLHLANHLGEKEFEVHSDVGQWVFLLTRPHLYFKLKVLVSFFLPFLYSVPTYYEWTFPSPIIFAPFSDCWRSEACQLTPRRLDRHLNPLWRVSKRARDLLQSCAVPGAACFYWLQDMAFCSVSPPLWSCLLRFLWSLQGKYQLYFTTLASKVLVPCSKLLPMQGQ